MNVQVVPVTRASYSRTHSAVDLLRSDQTRDYFAQACRATDPESRFRCLNDVVIVNIPVADGLARRYSGRGIASQDLTQVARLGLTLAVHRFDPDRGPEFLSFAVPTIRGELKRHFRDRGWVVRPPRQVQELCPRIVDATAELAQRWGRVPTPSEVGVHLGVDERDVLEAQIAERGFAPPSLDRPIIRGQDQHAALPWSATLGRDDPGLDRVEAKMLLSPLLQALGDRDRRVLHLRFAEDRTQQEIGDLIGISQMQVSRILARVLRLAREELAA